MDQQSHHQLEAPEVPNPAPPPDLLSQDLNFNQVPGDSSGRRDPPHSCSGRPRLAGPPCSGEEARCSHVRQESHMSRKAPEAITGPGVTWQRDQEAGEESLSRLVSERM